MSDRYSWLYIRLILISPIFMQRCKYNSKKERRSISMRSPCHELWWNVVERSKNTKYTIFEYFGKVLSKSFSSFLRRTSSKIINSSIVFPRFILQYYCYDRYLFVISTIIIPIKIFKWKKKKIRNAHEMQFMKLEK